MESAKERREMARLFRKISAIVSGKISHINKVCAPESIDLFQRIEKLPMPYSLLFYWLMVQTYGSFTNSFTVGIFSNVVKKLDAELTRKVFGVYLCYGTWLFTQTKGFEDFKSLFPNFNTTDMYSTLFKLSPYAEKVKKRIDHSSDAGGEPAAGLPNALEEALGEKAKKDRTRDAAMYAMYGITYMRSMHYVLLNISEDLAKGKTGKFE